MFQTSSKSAVETTELTRSFGWDSSEAWQQHDIQELCRVMFDALEQKFKDTDQADLIQRLYEGKILRVFVVCSPVCISSSVYSSLFPRIAC
jgi:ubiquitin carboxyl-terminal hydrolase 47